ncbi:MAG: SDR family NAD(P)-dependent oxidoreductase [Bryobacteraceae bacterium]
MIDRTSLSVLVTGASRGIGFDTALALAGAGFRVWAGVRNEHAARVVCGAARDRGGSVTPVLLDVTDAASVNAAFATIGAGREPLYGVVNNAGVTGRAFFEDYTEDEIARILDTNLFGTMRVTRGALPLLRKAGRGRIVIMSSVAGRLGQVCLAPYAASKFALEGLGESLWQELRAFRIDVSIIEPGIVAATDIWRDCAMLPATHDPRSPYAHLYPAVERQTAKLLKAARLTPSDVAGLVVRAMTARRPKIRYVAGFWTGWLLRAKRYMPGETFERLCLKHWLRELKEKAPGRAPDLLRLV